MSIQFFILGFESASGLSKKTNEPYDFANLGNLNSIRNWKSDKGESRSRGFTIEPDKCIRALSRLVPKLESLTYPCVISVDIGADEEDMSKTIITAIHGSMHVDIKAIELSYKADASSVPK